MPSSRARIDGASSSSSSTAHGAPARSVSGTELFLLPPTQHCFYWLHDFFFIISLYRLSQKSKWQLGTCTSHAGRTCAKRMRAHFYTYAYTGSVQVITCKYMWSNAAFDSTLATPRFGIIRTSYEQLWSRKRIHAQDLHVRQHLRALRMCARIRPQPRYGGNVKSASHGARRIQTTPWFEWVPRNPADLPSRPPGQEEIDFYSAMNVQPWLLPLRLPTLRELATPTIDVASIAR